MTESKKISFEVHESHIVIWEAESNIRYIIIMGGRGNGRSGTASRFAVSKLLGVEYMRGAIMRATREDIRASCWGEIMDRLREQDIVEQFHITENDMFIERGQNSLRAHGFRASSGSLTARLKSLAGYNFVWIEEAEEIGENEFRTLDDTLRTVKGKITIVLTLNTPAKSHWIIKKWFDLSPHLEAQGFYIPKIKEEVKDAIYIGGTYRENLPNLDESTVWRYQNYKNTNPNYYWQVIEGLSPDEVRGKIYTGWQMIDSIPQEARLVKLGEDFGWFPDPASLISVYYWNGAYILDELAYGTELTNEYLAQEAIKCTGRHSEIQTIADSAEPKSIAEQRSYGMNVIGCEKGKDSVSFRIKATSQKKIYVTKRSKNIWESYENYRWAEDKDGNPKGVPEHNYSHAMDAVSYAIASMHNRTNDFDIVYDTKPIERKNPAR
jgi:phage terminase large subunit